MPTRTIQLRNPPTRKMSPLTDLDTESILIKTAVKECEDYETFASSFLDSCQDEILSAYKEEFEKMLAVIKTSRYKFEKIYVNTDIVKEEILSNDLEIELDKITTDDEALKTLRRQYQRAQRVLSKSEHRQEELSTTLTKLKSDIGNLGYITKQGVELSQAQQKVIDDLESAKDVVFKELKGKAEQISKLKGLLDQETEAKDVALVAKQALENDIIALKAKSTAKKAEIEKETLAKEKLEKEVRQLRILGTQKQQETTTKQFNITKITDEIKATESQIKSQQAEIEKLVREEEVLNYKKAKIKQDFDEQVKQTRELEAKNEILIEEEKLKAQKLLNQKQDLKKLLKLKHVLVKKTRELEETKTLEENARKNLRAENEEMLVAVSERKKKIEIYKKNLDDLNRERDILNEFLKKTSDESTRLFAVIQFQKDNQAYLEIDLSRLRKEIFVNSNTLTTLKTDLDSLNSESEALSRETSTLLSGLKDKELQIFECNREILQAETKLLHQQSLYDSIQKDRQSLSKELIEKNNEIKLVKRAVKDMGFEMEGVRREVEGKKKELQLQTEDIDTIQKETTSLNEEIQNLKAQIEASVANLKTQVVEEEKLDKFAGEAEKEKKKQEKRVESVLLEKEKVAGLAREKSKELSDLSQRLKDQKLLLSYGETEYKQVLKRIEEIHKQNVLIRVEISEGGNNDEEGLLALRNESIKLQKEITQAESKITFLNQELENPMNIHRWRKLECSDPETFKMVQLLHTLQKKVISKNEEIAAKELAIQEKEKVFLQLKTTLTKQAGPEAVLQLSEYHKARKEKSAQLGRIETELNVYKAQVDEYRYDIQVLDTEIAACKRRAMEIFESRSKAIPVPAEPTLPIDSIV